MEIENFVAGSYKEGYEYKYFTPTPINHQWEWSDSMLAVLLEKASVSLGELNSYARLVPDVSLFIQLHVTKEAVISSRIEGTQTGMDDALLPIEEINIKKRDDWQEVQNYTRAMNYAINQLPQLPLSNRLLKNTHRILLEGVRGKPRLDITALEEALMKLSRLSMDFHDVIGEIDINPLIVLEEGKGVVAADVLMVMR